MLQQLNVQRQPAKNGFSRSHSSHSEMHQAGHLQRADFQSPERSLLQQKGKNSGHQKFFPLGSCKIGAHIWIPRCKSYGLIQLLPALPRKFCSMCFLQTVEEQVYIYNNNNNNNNNNNTTTTTTTSPSTENRNLIDL